MVAMSEKHFNKCNSSISVFLSPLPPFQIARQWKINQFLMGKDMENTKHNQTLPCYLNILNSSLFSTAQILSAIFHSLL